MKKKLMMIDEDGSVRGWQLGQGTGHEPLDAALPSIVEALDFAPAYAGRDPTCVWFRIPLTFGG